MPTAISTAELLDRLPVDPTTEDLRPVARELARAASLREYPGKSLAQAIRSAQRVGKPTPLLEALKILSYDELEILRSRPACGHADTPPHAWLTVEQTAGVLRKTARTIRGWLETEDGRRRLGWPWFDGREWQIPEPAVNSATRAAYMATQPLTEPAAYRASLPAALRERVDQ